MSYFVTPLDDNRRAKWLEALNRDSLPVADPRPRMGNGGLVFDIEIGQLSQLDVARLAGVLSQQNASPYWDALHLVREEGVSLPAIGLALVMQDEE